MSYTCYQCVSFDTLKMNIITKLSNVRILIKKPINSVGGTRRARRHVDTRARTPRRPSLILTDRRRSSPVSSSLPPSLPPFVRRARRRVSTERKDAQRQKVTRASADTFVGVIPARFAAKNDDVDARERIRSDARDAGCPREREDLARWVPGARSRAREDDKGENFFVASARGKGRRLDERAKRATRCGSARWDRRDGFERGG